MAPPLLPAPIAPHPHWLSVLLILLQCMGCGKSGLRGACVRSRAGEALDPGPGPARGLSAEARSVVAPRCSPNPAILQSALVSTISCFSMAVHAVTLSLSLTLFLSFFSRRLRQSVCLLRPSFCLPSAFVIFYSI